MRKISLFLALIVLGVVISGNQTAGASERSSSANNFDCLFIKTGEKLVFKGQYFIRPLTRVQDPSDSSVYYQLNGESTSNQIVAVTVVTASGTPISGASATVAGIYNITVTGGVHYAFCRGIIYRSNSTNFSFSFTAPLYEEI